MMLQLAASPRVIAQPEVGLEGAHAMIVRPARIGLESAAVSDDIPSQAVTVAAACNRKGSSAGSAYKETNDPRREP